jgi:hypothetical protein
MPLVSCKECQAEVADSAPSCPKCGVSKPGVSTGAFVLLRTSTLNGSMYDVDVFVDDRKMGVLSAGASVSLELSAGAHSIRVSGGMLKKTAIVQISKGGTVRYNTFFSNWGFLGGGLILEPM